MKGGLEGRGRAALWWRWFPLLLAVVYSALAGCYIMHVGTWDLSVPWNYPFPTYDEVWQLHLTKSVLDNGWILENPYLGAPGQAQWFINAAPQTSGLHSMVIWMLGLFIDDAVRVQQVYFLLNFPLITVATYAAARLLRIGRVPAVLVGVVFSFLAYRFNSQIYSYLGNYFCIPLALVPVYWTFLGRYAAAADNATATPFWRLLVRREFLIGVLCTVLVVLSDGYYAFFTLLLLGFASGARLLAGDWRAPRRFVAPVALMLVLIGLASAIMLPLKQYERAHREEFYPGGVVDPAMVKRPMEAEVYSTSLKLMVTPIPGAHRVPLLASIGTKLVASSNEVRKFPRGANAPLGILGSVLLFSCFALVAVRSTGKHVELGIGDSDGDLIRLVWASLAMALFVFLCSIDGGLGTLIAFVYPSIRAYGRFSVFLTLILYLGAAAGATAFIRASVTQLSRALRVLLVFAVALLTHLDQIPLDAWHASESDRNRYLAERAFVKKVEASLPKGAMVYNYPYSQYLTDNPYYGWGAYGQIRLYMHSRGLRWSNGSGKNTAVERWHARQASQSAEQLLAEMAAVGFKGVVVDRMVVGDEEYAQIQQAAVKVGASLKVEDEVSRQAFFALPDPGFTLAYDEEFRAPKALIVRDLNAFDTDRVLPVEIRRKAVLDILAARREGGSVDIEATTHPEAFVDGAKLAQGSGEQAIDMAALGGSLQCSLDAQGNVALGLHNGSDFLWALNANRLPLTIGVNLLAEDDSVVDWDVGLRIRDRRQLSEGQTLALSFPMEILRAKASLESGRPVFARFALLQEGNAWSNTIKCSVQVTP